ncbi:MAG: hypothetical protein QOC67_4732 [Pseudonocardiales bacterium]|jgi:hypothetical protein|nr:hypothetical protein [Pseudonocardiales bacterium]MDT7684918.1 hypothetical protein [Pseudonocardiales bacterium]MDT7775808.1 hypothetical protein [Pseudonocardiales bacterium]
MVAICDSGSMRHRTVVITELDKETVQVVCDCGWQSGVFGADCAGGRPGARQQAAAAEDLHRWDIELTDSGPVRNRYPRSVQGRR